MIAGPLAIAIAARIQRIALAWAPGLVVCPDAHATPSGDWHGACPVCGWRGRPFGYDSHTERVADRAVSGAVCETGRE